MTRPVATSTPAALVGSRTPQPGPSIVAAALAHSFLAAVDWSRASLVGAGAEVLGARRRWLGPLADDLLAFYREAPVDAPRELTRVIEQSPPFVGAAAMARATGRPLRVIRYPTAPGGARATSAHVPRIDHVGALATLLQLDPSELDWLADTKHWNRRTPPGRLHHYRYEWRRRPGRVPRLLEIPTDRMKRAQRLVLDEILTSIPLHDAAHGFVPSRSAATGAELHTGAEVVIALDLSAFFASVTGRRVYGALRQVGLPESVAHVLTGLCTHAIPPWAARAMPPGGSAEERFALRRTLSESHLPQGAPSSPALANLAVRRLDSRLTGWADAAGATYTRYADDLAFSGGEPLARRADAFIRGATRIVEDEGHRLNPRKTRVRRASVRQQITGIVVNQRTNVPRTEYDRLKAIIHNCVIHGPLTQNRGGHPEFRAHLLGRISWVRSLNPQRGDALLAEFARIRW